MRHVYSAGTTINNQTNVSFGRIVANNFVSKLACVSGNNLYIPEPIQFFHAANIVEDWVTELEPTLIWQTLAQFDC